LTGEREGEPYSTAEQEKDETEDRSEAIGKIEPDGETEERREVRNAAQGAKDGEIENEEEGGDQYIEGLHKC